MKVGEPVANKNKYQFDSKIHIYRATKNDAARACIEAKRKLNNLRTYRTAYQDRKSRKGFPFGKSESSPWRASNVGGIFGHST